MAGLNLATSSNFNLILFVCGSIVFISFFCFLLCKLFWHEIIPRTPSASRGHGPTIEPTSRFNQNHHSDHYNDHDNDDDDEDHDLVPENKPKLPVIITRDSAYSLRSLILEVSNSCDIFESMSKYALKRQRGINILSGSGTVRNVSLRQPGVAGLVVMLHGTFEILSLSGSFVQQPAPPSAFVPPVATGLTIFLAVGQGQVAGGVVVGKLMAVGPVTLIASSYTQVSYERLPLEEEEETVYEVKVGCEIKYRWW